MKFVAMLLVVILLCGCAYQPISTPTPAPVKTYEPGGEPQIGMTESDVCDIAWGLPDHINTDITDDCIYKQFVYDDEDGMPYRYIYLEDGIVTAVSYH